MKANRNKALWNELLVASEEALESLEDLADGIIRHNEEDETADNPTVIRLRAAIAKARAA